jgi:hypothetical protein
VAASLVTVRDPSDDPSTPRISISARQMSSFLDTMASMELCVGPVKGDAPSLRVTSASICEASGQVVAVGVRTQDKWTPPTSRFLGAAAAAPHSPIKVLDTANAQRTRFTALACR